MSSFPKSEQDPSASLVAAGSEGSIERSLAVATFYFARIHHLPAWTQALGAHDALTMITELRNVLTGPVLSLGGELGFRKTDSILAVFSHRAEDARPNHAQRALHASILCVHELVQFAKTWPSHRGNEKLPPLRITAGVHLGVGELSRRRAESKGRVFATGEAVEVVRQLEGVAVECGWSIATTTGTQVAAAGRVQRGRSVCALVAGATPTEIVEVTGLTPRNGSTTPKQVYDTLRASIAENQTVP